MCWFIIDLPYNIFLSSGVLFEKNSRLVAEFLVIERWASVRQGIICPPDFPATKQIVDE